MKIIKTTRRVDPETITEYVCDADPECHFKAADKVCVQRHYGERHASKETRYIDGEKFLRFESNEDFKAWAAWAADNDNCLVKGAWSVPGWYQVWMRQDQRAMGCCANYNMHARLAKHTLDAWRTRIQDLVNSVKMLEVLSGESKE